MDRAAAAWRARAGAGFAVVQEKPFVALGDEPVDALRAHVDQTVRWAATRLRRDFFAHDLERPIAVWLFRGSESYRRNAKRLFGDTPDTPYGYYSAAENALVMNIATGGGTLVHEMVHPYMRVNFPACPAWFNEGMGSLFEQSSERDGHIVGLTNWRLAGLQDSLRAGALPSFKSLTGMSADAFYAGDVGTHYAMARYLCYYLQEKGLLRRYYSAFVAGQRADPTGYKTLQRLLGERDMPAFQRRWERWVKGLRFDG